MSYKTSHFHIPTPDLQIDFAFALRRIRGLCLQEALGQTIRELDISQLDKELGRFVPPKALRNSHSMACAENWRSLSPLSCERIQGF